MVLLLQVGFLHLDGSRNMEEKSLRVKGRKVGGMVTRNNFGEDMMKSYLGSLP